MKRLVLGVLILGLSAAALTIPPDQPICNLYNILKVLGTVVGVLVAAYAGFILASSQELTERNGAKALLGGVVMGLIIIWLAPLLITNLVGSSSICGWVA